MKIKYFESLVSTNDTARVAAREGAPALYTVAAKRQTGGRGRMGRSFLSPLGGTYFSTVLRPTFDRTRYGAITPFAALAVHRAVKELLSVSLEIKWVNDLLLNGKKVCGILAESGEDKEGKPFVILGIGINTGTDPLPKELAEIAACVPYQDRTKLIERILYYLSAFESEIANRTWIEDYRLALSCLQKRVLVIRGNEKKAVQVLDVDAEGGLLVLYPDGTREILTGGEISIRQDQTKI